MKKIKMLLLGLSLALGWGNTGMAAAEVESGAGFKSLFNGKDLEGWRGNANLWLVRDEAITGITKADPFDKDPKISSLKQNAFLVYTNGDFSDFELRLSYRIVAGSSGIQYRSTVYAEGIFGPVVSGYQGALEAGPENTGILYEERGRGILATRGQKAVIRPDPERSERVKTEVLDMIGVTEDIQAKIKSEGWNDYVIIAKGNRLQHYVNGLQTVDVTDEHTGKTAASGIVALQLQVGPPMTVQFKNIRIKPLKK